MQQTHKKCRLLKPLLEGMGRGACCSRLLADAGRTPGHRPWVRLPFWPPGVTQPHTRAAHSLWDLASTAGQDQSTWHLTCIGIILLPNGGRSYRFTVTSFLWSANQWQECTGIFWEWLVTDQKGLCRYHCLRVPHRNEFLIQALEYDFRNNILDFSCSSSLSKNRNSTALEHDSCKNYHEKEVSRFC